MIAGQAYFSSSIGPDHVDGLISTNNIYYQSTSKPRIFVLKHKGPDCRISPSESTIALAGEVSVISRLKRLISFPNTWLLQFCQS